ncbi:hypothetical protein C0J52_08597 [Blattella germanica]|nr:hypothetical protein C0J52_08597 [Blattella germanica]
MRGGTRTEHPLDEDAVNNFREYLRIPSVQPDVNYDECVNFFRRQAEGLDLPIKVIELTPHKPIVVITWEGEEPTLQSIMLNTHMDVVPVYPEYWKYPPFSAEKDEEGNIYGRGAQDTKAAGIQYLEAIRRLKSDGIRLKRTIHITFMPDTTFHCKGTGGAPELLHSNTAAEKARLIIDKGGGDTPEVPDQLDITFDMRVAVTQDHDQMAAMLQSWCDEAGPGVHISSRKMKRTEPTKLDNTNPWWRTFKTECEDLGMTLKPVICPAAGDCRYLRQVGIPVLGFAPMINTQVRMHDHDEYLNEQVFLRGIDIYSHLIPAIANLKV